jgi:DNA primase
MECQDAEYGALRDAILQFADSADPKAKIIEAVGEGALENLLGQPHLKIHPALRRVGDLEFATNCLTTDFKRLFAQRSHAREVDEGMDEMQGQADESLTWRLAQAAQAVDTSVRESTDETADFEKADNGTMLNKDERSAFDKLLGTIKIDKSSKE